MVEMLMVMTHLKMMGMVEVVVRVQEGVVMRVLVLVFLVVDQQQQQRYVQVAVARILPEQEQEGGRKETTTIFCGCSVRIVGSGGMRSA